MATFRQIREAIRQLFTRPRPAPRPRRPHRSDSLTAQKVLDALREYHPRALTVADIELVAKSKSVQSALYALIRDGYVAREREGRRYVYRLVSLQEVSNGEALVEAPPLR
jgi:hypothetical protein